MRALGGGGRGLWSMSFACAAILASPSIAQAAVSNDGAATSSEVSVVESTPTDRRSTRRSARRAARRVALEANGVLTRELVPTSFLGFDAALSIGSENFYLRGGGALMGAPSFRLAANTVSNVLAYGLVDGCAAKQAREHRIRMCVGGELGAWGHRWRGYGEALRKRSAHIAGTLKGDYQYAFTDRLGLLLGVGVSIPAVGPQFRGRDQFGRPTPIVIPGPVAGTLRIGATFRFK